MSGLSHHPGKVAQGQLCRGFESLSLRQEVNFKQYHPISKTQYIQRVNQFNNITMYH
jgi:hypothetical protein